MELDSDPNYKPDYKWQYEADIYVLKERENILFQLRYQVAFAIFVLITGIWTILATLSQGYSNVDIIILGWTLSIIVITMWRYFAHSIIQDANELAIDIFNKLFKLGLFEDHLTEYTKIEDSLKLSTHHGYTSYLKSLTPKDQNRARLRVMAQLQNYIPNAGILRFDAYSLIFLIVSLLLGITAGVYEYFQPPCSINPYLLMVIPVLSILCIIGMFKLIFSMKLQSCRIDAAILAVQQIYKQENKVL